MKFAKYIVTVSLFFIFQSLSAQEKPLTKKNVEQMLMQSGDALFDLNSEKSLNLAKKALNGAHLLKDDLLMAKAYNVIGLNFEEFSDVKEAILYYNKALYHANKTANDSVKDWIYNNLGNVYTYRKINFNRGIDYYKKGLIYSNRIKDSTEITYTQLNIVSAFFAIGNFKDGLVYLESSKKYVAAKGELEAKISLYSLYGSYYSYINQNQKAEDAFQKAIFYGKQNQSPIVDATVCEVYGDFANHYKKTKDYEKAFVNLEIYKNLKEKIYNEDRSRKVKIAASEIELDEVKRQIDKVEGEKHAQSKDLKESKIIVLLFVIIFFILLLLLFSMYKNNRFRDKTNEELKLTNYQLKLAKDSAEEASRLKTQFVSTITHELRTPLYGVVGITNIILDEHKELANSPHLNSLKFSAGYLLSLVNDLLQINKIEENRITLEKMIFNVSDELSTIVDSLQFIARKNNNKLVVIIDPTIPESLIGDKLRLSQVFMNLISNALKFTKDGVVTVAANLAKKEDSSHYIEFLIKDTGVGIAKEDQSKIFEKFVQIERKEGDYQGTGLGLSIVKKLVEIFGGKIELESEEGVGTTFSFTIAFEADDRLRNEIINNIEVDLSTSYFYRVLVVEDNKINQIVTKKILESNNFKCTIIDDGYAAIDILEKEKFDVVLMDINMPIINGFDTTKLIRKKGINIPIIALTAFDKQEITEQALSSGMNDIIIKPFEQAKLFQVIASLIDKKNAD